MNTFIETEENTTLAEVQKMEALLGLNFPPQYVDHILKYNGGACTANVFEFIENGKTTHSSVDWFLAIYDGEYNNFKWYIETYKLDHKRLPTHIVPIANDPGGNLICISCGNEDYGHIYFWDHENEVDYNKSNDSDYSNLFLIADSFNEFINGLNE